MSKRCVPALVVCLVVVGCSGDVPVAPTGPGPVADVADPVVTEPPPLRLLELAPPEQIAKPGEKPIYNLPLQFKIEVPEAPEGVRKPSGPLMGK
jgi:hypothetical protein